MSTKQKQQLGPAKWDAAWAQLEPGLYRLSQDVLNPAPQKNRVDWTYREKWEAGKLFAINDNTSIHCKILRAVNTSYAYLNIVEPDTNDPTSSPKDEHRLAAIMPHLVKLPPTLGGLLLNRNIYERQAVLTTLVDSGKISLDDVRQALATMDASSEAQDDERDMRNGIR